MKKVKCTNGHFYDLDSSKLCPHCGMPETKGDQVTVKESIVNDKAMQTTGEPKASKGVFGWMKSSKKEVDKLPKTEQNTAYEVTTGNSIPQAVYEEEDEQKTFSLWGDNTNTGINHNEVAYQGVEEKEDLDENKTIALQSVVKDIDDIKTVSKYEVKGSSEPMAGWLVCTKGTNFGCAYEIKMGQSSIGRSNDMRICIKDESITRERHAFIIFEAKKRQFFLRSGDGSGLTYCNDELVAGMVPLKAYDKIQLGDAEFLFMPLCGEQFMWEEN